MGESELQERLSAMADGELDAAQAAQVLRQMAGRPELVATLERYVRLTEAARKICTPTPTASPALRAKIAALAVDEKNDGSTLNVAPQRRMVAWRVAWTAAAAALIVGLLVGYLVSNLSSHGNIIAVAKPQPIPATLVAGLTHTHVDCSRFASALHSAPFPTALGDLAADLRADLDSQNPYPDLTKVGYKFVGAGPCGAVMTGTVHLLYHSISKNLNDSVSIFVQANTGQFGLERGKAYQIGDAGSAHPMIVWRSDNVVYFLVGNDWKVVEKAKNAVGIAKS